MPNAEIKKPAEIERLLSTFRAFLEPQQLAPKSIRNYLSDVRSFLTWSEEHGKIPPSTPHFLEYKEALLARSTPVSTINRHMASLRQFSSFLENIRHADMQPQDISNVSLTTPAHLTSSDRALKLFKQALHQQHCSDSTIKNYADDIRLFYDFFGSNAVFELLTKPNIGKFLGSSKQQALAPTTMARRKASLKRFCQWAKDSEYIKTNPLESFAENIAQKPLLFFERFRGKPVDPTQSLFHRIYARYTNWPASSYIHLSVLVLFAVMIGVFGYQQFFQRASQSLAFPTALTRPNRVLSFQGRLTDSTGTPITSSTSMIFGLYNHITNGAITDVASTGGPLLWKTITCAIVPDQDGIFSTLLGSSCGAELDSNIFTENPNIYLEVKVGAEVLTPRQQIATVGYALNSETLQGYPASASAVENTVLIMNNAGSVVLGNSTPTIQATSGTFVIKGNVVTLSSNTGTGGNVNITPDGTGQVNVTGGTSTTNFFNLSNASLTSGNLITGTVGNNNTGYKFISFTGGSSPTEKFSVNALGGITGSNALTVPVATISATYSTATPLIVNGTGGQIFSINNSGTVTTTLASGAMYSNSGALASEAQLASSRGGTGANLSAATQGSVPYFSATGIMSALAPTTSGYVLTTQGVGANPIWTNSASVGTNYWQLNTPVLAPGNTTLDLAIGGSATASAKFQIFGMTGNATTSGTLTFRGASYSNNLIAAQNMAGLQIGDGNTGNILFQGGNVGIGYVSPSYKLAVAGTGYFNDNLNIENNKLLQFYAASGNTAYITNSSGNVMNFRGGASGYRFDNNASTLTLVTIQDGGNVGIGTTVPGTPLEVNNSASVLAQFIRPAAGPQIKLGADSTTNYATWGYTLATDYASLGTQAYINTLVLKAGNVGIGTTGPLSNLDILGANVVPANQTYGNLNIRTNNAQAADIGGSLTFGGFNNDAASSINVFGAIAGRKTSSASTGNSGYLNFLTNNTGVLTEQMRITSTGNVGIGTTAPGAKLDILGVTGTSGVLNISNGGTGTHTMLNFYNANSDPSSFRNIFIANQSRGTLTAPTALVSGDQIFTVAGSGHDGTGYQSKASLDFIVDGTVSTGVVPTAIDFKTSGTSGARASVMRITSTGNVGIGTTGPSYALDVLGLTGIRTRGSATANELLLNPTIDGYGVYLRTVQGSGQTAANMYLDPASGNVSLLDGSNAFQLNVYNAATQAISLNSNGNSWLNANTGNVGIGTTNPLAKLHVEASCVTGDTMLPIRRRRRRKSNGLESEDDDLIFDYLLCRIDEILPGDEVLSLNEFTGVTEYARINALMDMDIREVYELTTKSGKVIRTTANHPYLTLLENNLIISKGKINL